MCSVPELGYGARGAGGAQASKPERAAGLVAVCISVLGVRFDRPTTTGGALHHSTAISEASLFEANLNYPQKLEKKWKLKKWRCFVF